MMFTRSPSKKNQDRTQFAVDKGYQAAHPHSAIDPTNVSDASCGKKKHTEKTKLYGARRSVPVPTASRHRTRWVILVSTHESTSNVTRQKGSTKVTRQKGSTKVSGPTDCTRNRRVGRLVADATRHHAT